LRCNIRLPLQRRTLRTDILDRVASHEGRRMQRREFIGVLASAAVAWPHAARTQQTARVRRIGVLMNRAVEDPELHARLAAFLQELPKLGWTEGRNVHIDARWSAVNTAEIRRYAVELVALAPDVIFTVVARPWDRCCRQPVRSRSYSRILLIRSGPALSRACRGLAATRLAS